MGMNWLFFGHQRQRWRFFYGRLTHAHEDIGLFRGLSLAWSATHQEILLQDRNARIGRELVTWLAAGANIYICGERHSMAKDANAARRIARPFGARSLHRRGRSFVGELKKKGRFSRTCIESSNLLQMRRIKFSFESDAENFLLRMEIC